MILALGLVSMLVSLWRGFIREVFSILVWVAAAFAAFRLSPVLALRLEDWIDLPSARFITAFVVVFVLVLVVGGLIGFLVGKLVEKTGLSATDRLFGALFGLARAMVLVVVAVLLLKPTPFSQDPWWRESRLIPRFEQLADQVVVWLPDEFRRLLSPEAQTVVVEQVRQEAG
ncbi:MAG: CvpA family protein [Wenzhouxiangellaceae bacterium]